LIYKLSDGQPSSRWFKADYYGLARRTLLRG
jgi:hypothetical protein